MSYAILGGCGFIGRNIVEKLVEDSSCTKIIVCDKRRPEMSWLTPHQTECFSNPRVIYKQINLANEKSVSDFFDEHPCDIMINSASETRQLPCYETYEENIFHLGMVVAKQAAKMGCKKFIQITSARVKVLGNLNRRETTMTGILKAQQKLESDLATIEGLNYVILRPALVYGMGDTVSILPMLIVMAIYKNTGEELKVLWTENIKTRTVHAMDVAEASVFLGKSGESGKIYEICDKSESTHGKITKELAGLFDTKYKFMGKLENMMAESFFETAVRDINEKHLDLWSKACSKDKITNTPLLPNFTEEQLMLDDFEVDSTPLEDLGFKFTHPTFEAAQLKEILKAYVDQGIFPKSLYRLKSNH
ncbi:hypothetical protein RF11_11777 [Thelohanellus kitauei]|uniref:NAD-dependent epimerase/dehydratase domain-containing protein n=1 Tax=Thelohanellus kitauei TaxID=669202 RepID=A0A0C2MG73_THEKT|nr:hypothetical protein RF11_11777 [Thelohanellus kitauei]